MGGATGVGAGVGGAVYFSSWTGEPPAEGTNVSNAGISAYDLTTTRTGYYGMAIVILINLRY